MTIREEGDDVRPTCRSEADCLAVVPLEPLDVLLQSVGRDHAERHEVHAAHERVPSQECVQLRVRLAP